MKKLLIIAFLFSQTVLANVVCPPTSVLMQCLAQQKKIKKKVKKAVAKPAEAEVKVVPKVTQLPDEVHVDNTRRNTIYLYAHRTHLRTDTEVSGNKATVYSRRATVPGLGYMRHTDSGLALGIACDVLKNAQLSVGLDF